MFKIVDYIMSGSMGVYFVLFLIAFALFSLIFPQKIITFKDKNSASKIIFVLFTIFIFLFQLVVCFMMWWGIGMKYAETGFVKIIDLTPVFLLIAFALFLYLSINIQGRKKELTTVSPVVAFFVASILAPAFYFLVISLIGKLIIGK